MFRDECRHKLEIEMALATQHMKGRLRDAYSLAEWKHWNEDPN